MEAKPALWQDLQFFLATARAGTLSAAADALGVNASTVHRRLAALEATLTARLFDRSPRGYALTAAGSDLLQHALAMEAEVHDAERRIAGRDQSLSGSIRVATVDDLCGSLLGPIFRDFRTRHRKVCLDVAIDSDPADLARREADVAIRPGSEPKTGNVIARRVCSVGVALYASRAYLSRRGTPPSLERLKEHSIVRGDEGRSHLAMERFLDRYVEPSAVAFRSNSMLARLHAIRHGLGIGMLPCFSADREPAIVRIGAVRAETSANLWILIHADLRRNARVRVFADFIYDELMKMRAYLEGQ
jgi:DNA-binding transcriptional LysR family regulator